jgi:outer membrane biosynthesis protein TonB
MVHKRVCLFLCLAALCLHFTPVRMLCQTAANSEPRVEQKSSPAPHMEGSIKILSDTMGVDFGSYLQRALPKIKSNWYKLIQDVARPPILKSGTLIIQFAIMKDGSVRGMALQMPSGDVQMDRAAWGGITASDPFDPLPSGFSGSSLVLRIKFAYNQTGVVETNITSLPQEQQSHSSTAPTVHFRPQAPAVAGDQNDGKDATRKSPDVALDPKRFPSPLSRPLAVAPTEPFVTVEVVERANLSDNDLNRFAEEALKPVLQRCLQPSLSGKAREVEIAKTAIVSFAIRQDGAFDSVKLDQSSGNLELDKTVGECVKLSGPVALPKGFAGDHIGVKARFVNMK